MGKWKGEMVFGLGQSFWEDGILDVCFWKVDGSVLSH